MTQSLELAKSQLDNYKKLSKIELENGKYTVSHDNGTNFHALRYGEEWRNLTGDGLILAMAHRIEKLEIFISKAFQAHPNLDLDIGNLDDYGL